MKNNRGITLIALVITIIVMLILVGVTISMAVNGGLFEKAGEAVRETNTKLQEEAQLAEGGVKVGDTWYNSIDEYLVASGNKKELISKETDYVGYYADFEGDGTIDGVIYADLAVGNTEDGEWIDSAGVYTIPKETDLTLLKDYYVSGTYDGAFNEEGKAKDVLTPTGEGKDRFYVMALEDIGTTAYTWYESGASNGITVSTETGFGTGKKNTATMIEIWNEDTDVAKSNNDLWKVIQDSDYDLVENETDSNKWFVPSKAEWAAFSEELRITDENYSSFGLSSGYSTSSQGRKDTTWYIYHDMLLMYESTLQDTTYIRLSSTF